MNYIQLRSVPPNFCLISKNKPFILKARHKDISRLLAEERAALTRFDNELKSLDDVIKSKKQSSSDAELHLKKFEHELQNLGKEKSASLNMIANLEKMYDWIVEEKQLVSPFPTLLISDLKYLGVL